MSHKNPSPERVPNKITTFEQLRFADAVVQRSVGPRRPRNEHELDRYGARFIHTLREEMARTDGYDLTTEVPQPSGEQPVGRDRKFAIHVAYFTHDGEPRNGRVYDEDVARFTAATQVERVGAAITLPLIVEG